MPDSEMIQARLAAGLEAMGIVLSGDQVERMIRYLLLLQRWNRAYNLTAVREPVEMVSRHLLDSLSVLPYLGGDRVLDVGTGAGLPGVPLAIAAPQRRFYLLDSKGKKVRFLRRVVTELELTDVVVVQARMEAYFPEREFATIVARAVAPVSRLVSMAARLAARPGCLLVMAGKRPAEAELRGSEADSGAVLGVHPLEVPFLDAERHLIRVHYN